jgi:hypothetical protein
MNLPANKLTREEQKTKALEAHVIKEEIFSLVTKIISWKTQARDSIFLQSMDRITPDEWQRYKKHLLSISKSESVEVVKGKLKAIYNLIQSNDGFK